jgi:uncharacterized protein with NRDE domain
MASRVAADAPLVVGANRDERTDRAAVPMAVLRASEPRILGGRDLLAGGTWLAVNQHGVVAGLTNVPQPKGRDPAKCSRGALPMTAALHRTAEQAVEALRRQVDAARFNPAWMLVGDRTSLFAVTIGDGRPTVEMLPPGIHVLENHPPSDPSPKVKHVLGLLGTWPVGGESRSLCQLLCSVLADHSRPARGRSDDPRPAAGSIGRPEHVMSACVHGEGFGTRWSAIIAVGKELDRLPSFLVADGAPCHTAFVSADELWQRDPIGTYRW